MYTNHIRKFRGREQGYTLNACNLQGVKLSSITEYTVDSFTVKKKGGGACSNQVKCANFDTTLHMSPIVWYPMAQKFYLLNIFFLYIQQDANLNYLFM